MEHDVAMLMRSSCARAARARVLSLVKTQDSGYAIFRSRGLVVEVLGDAPLPSRGNANTLTQRTTRRGAEQRQVLDPRGNIRRTWKVRGRCIRWIGGHYAEGQVSRWATWQVTWKVGRGTRRCGARRCHAHAVFARAHALRARGFFLWLKQRMQGMRSSDPGGWLVRPQALTRHPCD